MSEPPASPPREPPAAEASTAAARAARAALLAPADLPTRLTYVSVAGPSGVKQCFPAVKTARRIPTLPRKLPREGDAESPATPAPPAPRARRPGGDEHAKKHACPSCDKQFGSLGKLEQHARAHSGELPFACERCHKRFSSRFKLVRHGLIHSEARAFSCAACGKTFNRKDHLANHARVHNPAKKLHRCERPGCRKTYSSALSFRRHAALHAAEEGCLTCAICDQSFARRDDIVHHLKVHGGSRSVKSETDKKFPCPFCERRFFTGKDVRRHLVVHTGRRDFVCSHCPQKFGRKDHLVRHVKNAHAEEASRPQPEDGEYLRYLDRLFPQSAVEPAPKAEPPDEGRARSPQPGPSGVLGFPLYSLPQLPLLDMLEPELLLEAREEPPNLSSDVLELIRPGRVCRTERPTTLPTFTKAFQSTAPSRKPPPAPQ